MAAVAPTIRAPFLATPRGARALSRGSARAPARSRHRGHVAVAADATASGSSALDTLMGAKIIAPDGGGDDAVRSSVQTYYGETLQTSDDLKTSACCTPYDLPKRIRGILSNVPDEVKAKYYGCGSPTPQGIDGLRVLDLGSGSGRDCYVAAALVGESGRVTGVDMTDAQLDVAKKHAKSYCVETLGYNSPNMEFKKGTIEDLAAAGVGDAVEDRVSGVDRRHRAGLYGAFVARLREARPELLATAMRERRGRKRPRCVAGEGHAFAREQRGGGFRFNFL